MRRTPRQPCALFVGSNVRKAVAGGGADYIPVFLSETPALFRKGVLPLAVALVQVSPPDKHGFCSLGVSVDCSRAAVETAQKVIAQITPNMPRTHGDGIIHVSDIDCAVEVPTLLPSHPAPVFTDVETRIGRLVAALIEDGSCLQMGIGAIPDAVLAALAGHRGWYCDHRKAGEDRLSGRPISFRFMVPSGRSLAYL
jgi:4-hydroxybutyrate CoA-transferase